MKWIKTKWSYVTSPDLGSVSSHAALPVPIHLHNDSFRIFFSYRDENQRSHGAYVDIENIFDPNVLSNAKTVIYPGEAGYFDESGVNLTSCCLENNLFYYLGWSLSKNVPFTNRIGVAKLNLNKNEVSKICKCPIISVCSSEPISFGYPFVLKVGNYFKMWYDTIIKWTEDNPRQYISELRSAISYDGVNWTKQVTNLIQRNEGESCIARPCVLHDGEKFQMWFSALKNKLYSIGYAESFDGEKWFRMDENVGITVSETGWDSEQICYPYVFIHKGKKFMLYNGNGYGKTGFGLAILEVE
jgi:hypothetical protein